MNTFNYVRTCRERHALSDEDLAYLMGNESRTLTSKVERGRRSPTLDGALALQVLFELAPREMFPGRYEEIEDAVMRRAHILLGRLEGRTDSRSTAKREFLENLPRRSGGEVSGL